MQMSFLLWIFLNLQNIFNMSKMSEDTHTPKQTKKPTTYWVFAMSELLY